MLDHCAQKAGDLPRDERLIVERWLARPLSDDETISVNAYRPRYASFSDDVWEEVLTQARETGSRAPARDIGEFGLDAKELADAVFERCGRLRRSTP